MQSIEKLIQDFPSKEEKSKLPKDGGTRWNRLIFEQSPYLLQHAANPVDWYSWGDEAFEKAKREDKPVMLSIGYSTCHWCHVMEHECFEDSQVAALLNEHLICIKVDREERPDIDNLYMTLAQILIKRGGWPLNIFLTPDRKAFFAVTYVPKHSRQSSAGVFLGMLDLVPRIISHWKNSREQVLTSAENLLDVLTQANKSHKQEFSITDEALNDIYDNTFHQLEKNFDSVNGGFGPAPKFPSPHILGFLFAYHRRTKNQKALEMAELTLAKMRAGGLFDQLGKGFHRYSTDKQWLLPHFEKMLYDQATLLMAYSDAYALTQKSIYKNVITEIFEYLEHDLKSPLGAYFSAEDADSEGEEGKFYVWTLAELKSCLTENEYLTAITIFACEDHGNFHDEATDEKTGANILHLPRIDDLQNPLYKQIVEKLLAKRNSRVRPLLDDKILVDWNALLAVGLLKAYKASSEIKFLNSARSIIDFIFKELFVNNQLFKSYRQERSTALACINDFSFLAWALLDFYEIKQDEADLKNAILIVDLMINNFWSENNQAFSFNAYSSVDMPAPNFEFYDGAIPSGNSAAFYVLNKLFNLTQDLRFKDLASKLFSSYVTEIERYPVGYAQFISNLEFCFSDFGEQKFCGEGGCSV